ncbi:DinB family protein [Bacillus kexueae]|uniref:DinB family protein n=1 Tax=Aeribacillus kexueae TaxID=2078952 RepID=UPI001FAF8F58|nr:DinB family protein [Bacillus kexueae]
MENRSLFNQYEFVRHVLLHNLNDVSEEMAQEIPDGFPHHLLWQAGHVYVSLEQIVFHFSGEPVNIPEGYAELFQKGTRPSEWTKEPPSLEEIKNILQEQMYRVKETFENRLDEKIAQPFEAGPLKLETIGELLLFSLFHESEHNGCIKGIKNGLKMKEVIGE